MRGRTRAFATLASVCILVLAAVLVAGSLSNSRQLLLDNARLEGEVLVRASTWKAVNDTLDLMKETWHADRQTFDGWYSAASADLPAGVELFPLSGRINLNTMTQAALQDSTLTGTLLNRSVAEFVAYRSAKGPFGRLSDYKDFFRPEALASVYCVYSTFDVNTADETILEKTLSERTGDEAFAADASSRIGVFRAARQTIMDSDWDMIAGSKKDLLGDLVSTSPEIDANSASVDILEALLKDPDFKLEHADSKLQSIVNLRSSRPLTEEMLRQVLGVGKTDPLVQYLGVRCRFVGGTIRREATKFRFVVALSYPTDDLSSVLPRLVAVGPAEDE